MRSFAIGKVFFSILFAATALSAGCSDGHTDAARSGSSTSGNGPISTIVGNPGNGYGSVHMNLDIGTPPGASVFGLNWTITNGMTADTYTGTTDVGDAQSFEFAQGGIATGTGYTVTLTGSDNHGMHAQVPPHRSRSWPVGSRR